MSAWRALDSTDITGLLKAWGQGDQGALEQLTPLVYAQLRAQARRYMRNERSGVTLQSTALVHEVYLRLTNAQDVDWHDRVHFFALSAQLMRRILVDAARARAAAKRGGGAVRAEHSSAVDLDQIPDRRLGSRLLALRAGRRPREPDADRSAAGEGHRTAIFWRAERRGDRGRASGVTADRDARLAAGQGVARARAARLTPQLT